MATPSPQTLPAKSSYISRAFASCANLVTGICLLAALFAHPSAFHAPIVILIFGVVALITGLMFGWATLNYIIQRATTTAVTSIVATLYEEEENEEAADGTFDDAGPQV
jgi:membrane protein implicated in regulation of membrane protease activity